MNTKTKLILGLGLLLFLIILLGTVSARYVNVLKEDTDNILVANYNTLEYTRNMLRALDSGTVDYFEKNLRLQESNITEIGEKEATAKLRKDFEIFKKYKDPSSLPTLRKEIYQIMEMNMKSISKKSEKAMHTAETANFWIALTGTLCILIALTLFINLPSNIANPIKILNESIRQIADKNYSQRVDIESDNEFGDLAKNFNIMAEKLEEYNSGNMAKVFKEKSRIEKLINNMTDPVIGLDENLRIIFVNEEASKILGMNATSMIGQPVQNLADKNDLLRILIQEIMISEDTSVDKNKPLKIFANGKESYFEKEIIDINITPTGEQSKLFVGYVIILRNVTEYKELDSAKTNFIATVSHEFKTPIASIIMSVQLLENKQIGVLNPEQINLIQSIKEDAQRLLSITGELLNITQAESGKIQLSILPVDPAEILNYAINATNTQAELKHIEFDIDVKKGIPSMNADRDKTAWVLTNLISNAIHYSHEHSKIYLSISKKDSNIIFKVKDNGDGIPEQYLEKIFNRYFRVPGTNKEGTGLGLAICKEFIEAQGGKISVESQIGSGSTFIVTLNSYLH